ncbi:MAG TPA: hypothetical protein VGB04_07470 [Allosphingosinicella sp.]|jgi:hypothetical protein
MKPLLKSNVAFIPVDEGVYFESGQHNFLFKGRGLFPLVSRIVSLLDGTRTVAALEGIVPEKAHALLGLLLGELEQRRMVHMVVDTPEPPLPEHVESLYFGTIAFLKDETPHWPTVFRRWRETRILAAGAGFSYRVLVRNLMRSGAARLALALDGADDSSGDRDAITAAVAEAKSRDPEISVDWIDSDRAAEAAAAQGIRILYVSDSVPLGDGSLFRQLTAGDRPDVLAGGVYRGAALVGPEGGEGLSLLPIWDRIAAQSAGPPYSRAARAILGSVVAFQALKAFGIDEFAEPERRDWLRRHCFHVRPDNTTEVHRLIPEPPSPASDPPTALAAEPRADDSPLFDPVTGCLQWEDFAGAEFPLPHRAIRIQPDPAGRLSSEPIAQWALTPQDVDERATARALEALAESQSPAGAVDGSAFSPVLAARDEAAWRRDAQANAVARHPAFLHKASPVRIEAESIADQDARMLIRLVRLYGGELPHLWLLSGGAVNVACVAVKGQLYRAAAASPAKALVEALGDSLSAVQTGHRPQRQQPDFLGPLDSIEPDPELSAVALDSVADFAAPQFQFSEERLFPGGGASRRWIIGRVRAWS